MQITITDIDAIIIPEYRIRREFDAERLSALAESIAEKGLMHPIVTRDDGYTLIAGERRLRAISDLAFMDRPIRFHGEWLPVGTVPVVHLTDLSPLQQEEAELEENVIREALTWQEQSAATLRLAELRVRQAMAVGNPLPTTLDLAGEIRDATDTSSEGYKRTQKELAVARFLDDPDVAAAKSTKEAYKVVKRKEQARNHAEIARRVGVTFNASMHRAENRNAISWMLEAEELQFDVILTDPPYGMGADEFGDSGGLAAGAHGYDDTEENLMFIIEEFPNLAYRLAKQNAHLYIFCDVDYLQEWKLSLKIAGWKVFRTPLIWYKPNASRAPWPDKGPQRKYECILFAVKGDKKVNFMAGDVLQFPADENLGHAAQKPVALYQELLRRSIVAGDRVLDPFMGTGTIFPAAHGLKCIATGIEMDAASYGIAVSRLEGLKS